MTYSDSCEEETGDRVLMGRRRQRAGGPMGAGCIHSRAAAAWEDGTSSPMTARNWRSLAWEAIVVRDGSAWGWVGG